MGNRGFTIDDLKVIYAYITDPESVEEDSLKNATKKLELVIKESEIRDEYTTKINEVVQQLANLSEEK